MGVRDTDSHPSTDGEDFEHYIVPPDIELRRLRQGPMPDERPLMVTPDRIIAVCPGNAPDVLSRSREVLEAVIANTRTPWPTLDDRRRILPAWFVKQGKEEELQEEETVRDVAWRVFQEQGMPASLAFIRGHQKEFDQLKQEEAEHWHDPWTLSGWIYWFRPEERWWFWWDAQIPDADTLHVEVEAADYGFPSGALEWLLRAAGASQAGQEFWLQHRQ